MSRYTTLPRNDHASQMRVNPKGAYIDDEGIARSEGPHDLTVDGPMPINTGLIDLHGHSIYRLPPPIGFGRMEEWA